MYSCLLQSKEDMEETDMNVAHKEKSVLQAKLTKLAIQIGYVGMHVGCYCLFHCCWYIGYLM